MASSKECSDVPDEDQSLEERITKALLTFSWKLYLTSAEVKGSGNLFISPFSIAVALAMMYAGAKNETAREIQKTMNLDITEANEELHAAFSEILKPLISGSDKKAPFKLATANKLYLAKNYSVKDTFMKMLTKQYMSDIALEDFGKDSEKSRKKINTWVEKVTHKKIENLIPTGNLDSMTRLVLVNAIYFKGDWEHKFDKSLSEKDDFFRKSDAAPVKVTFMHSKNEYPYTESDDLDCKVLILPYKGQRLSMVIILPNEVDSLSTLEKSLNADVLNELIDAAANYNDDVKVAMPKFKLDSELPLKDVLQTIGIQKLFSQAQADLTGISPKGDLYLSDAFHKAFVDVNEKGTEAAAASSGKLMLFCASGPTTFKADHPFLFFIYDCYSRVVLFMGHLTDPQSVSG